MILPHRLDKNSEKRMLTAKKREQRKEDPPEQTKIHADDSNVLKYSIMCSKMGPHLYT